MMKLEEAVAKHRATARPGRPISRNRRKVPRPPSRTSMKPSMNRVAQNDRQNTTVQSSGVSMKRLMAPPKLQNSADRKTSRKPMRSSRRDTGGSLVVAAASVMAAVS